MVTLAAVFVNTKPDVPTGHVALPSMGHHKTFFILRDAGQEVAKRPGLNPKNSIRSMH